jgi:hypothetical protein
MSEAKPQNNEQGMSKFAILFIKPGGISAKGIPPKKLRITN